MKIPAAVLIGALIFFALECTVGAHQDGEVVYPYDCCHSLDCAPVSHVEVVASSIYYAGLATLGSDPMPPTVMTITTTMNRTAIVPPNMPRRESPDARMHACIGANNRLICIFMPPGM